jgi:hypothetical protein
MASKSTRELKPPIIVLHRECVVSVRVSWVLVPVDGVLGLCGWVLLGCMVTLSRDCVLKRGGSSPAADGA